MKLYKRKDDTGAETGPYWYRFVYKGRRPEGTIMATPYTGS